MEIIQSFFILAAFTIYSSFASSDINVCLTQHMPIELYNYASGQCLSSSLIENDDDKLQMHGCVGGNRFVFHAHRASAPYNNDTNVFHLVNKVSGKCLTAGIVGHYIIENTPVLQAPCDGSMKQQLWKNHDVWDRFLGSTYYQISSELNDNFCLSADASDISIPNRGFPYMFPCNYNHNDQWWLPAKGMC